jgi:predicted DNA-binding transcriptional regulator AlpA
MYENDILFAEDVCGHFRISRPTLKIWLRQARDGKIDFPLPVSPMGKKLRWAASDIYRWRSVIGNDNAMPKPENRSAAQRKRRIERAVAELKAMQ